MGFSRMGAGAQPVQPFFFPALMQLTNFTRRNAVGEEQSSAAGSLFQDRREADGATRLQAGCGAAFGFQVDGFSPVT